MHRQADRAALDIPNRDIALTAASGEPAPVWAEGDAPCAIRRKSKILQSLTVNVPKANPGISVPGGCQPATVG